MKELRDPEVPDLVKKSPNLAGRIDLTLNLPCSRAEQIEMHLYLLKFEVINLGSCFWLHRFRFKTKQIYLAHPMTDRNVFVINTNF